MKYKVGIFSFTGCEGCFINFLEIMNEKWLNNWKKYIDITYCKQLKYKNDDKNLDIAIIEGAISTEEELRKIQQIKQNSKIIILIGSCAINGAPSNQRNKFNENIKQQIKPFLQKWNHLDNVIPVKEVINIDYEVNGCPMDEKKFIEIFENIILNNNKN